MPTLPAGAAQPRGCLGCKEKPGMQQVRAELPLPAQHLWAHRGHSKSRASPCSPPHTRQTHSTSTAHYSTATSAASTAKPKHTAQQPAPNRHPKRTHQLLGLVRALPYDLGLLQDVWLHLTDLLWNNPKLCQALILTQSYVKVMRRPTASTNLITSCNKQSHSIAPKK